MLEFGSSHWVKEFKDSLPIEVHKYASCIYNTNWEQPKRKIAWSLIFKDQWQWNSSIEEPEKKKKKKNLNLGKRLHAWEIRREMWKKLGFVLIDFEEGCFSLLSLFHLSKIHVLVMCSSIPLNITAKVTPRCKVW